MTQLARGSNTLVRSQQMATERTDITLAIALWGSAIDKVLKATFWLSTCAPLCSWSLFAYSSSTSSASNDRVVCVWAGGIAEPISNPGVCQNVSRMSWIVLDLLPEHLYVGPQVLWLVAVLGSPDGSQNLC